LSALSPMCRTAFVLVTLAAFAATGARGVQVSTHTTHRKSASQHSSRLASRHYPANSAHRPAYAHTSVSSRRAAPSRSAVEHRSSAGRRHETASHRQSAEEVGWRAGLAIRGQLIRRRGSRTRATVREVRLRRAYSAQQHSAADFDTQTVRATPSYTPATPAVPNYPVQEKSASVRSTKMYEDAAASVEDNSATQSAAPASPNEGQAFASANDSAPAPAKVPAEMADDGAAPVQRMAPSATGNAGVTRNPEADAGAPLGSATADEDAEDRNSPPPTEAASARSETESEEASLTIPHDLMPSPLRGSLESLQRQNAKLDAEGLERIEDESDLAARIADGLLVPVPVSTGLVVNKDLLPNHRYCRPWTAKFLGDLAREHEAIFHKPLEVSSAVRTVEYQRRLMRTNGNAAPAEGDVVSPHLTGATVDIAKSGLSRQEMAWMRQRLLTLQGEGKIDAEEEFRQACFHITVYKNYAPQRTTRPRHHAAPPSEAEASGAAAGM